MPVFAGIELPPDLVSSMMRASQRFRHEALSWADEKWVPDRNIHVTSCFVGEVSRAALGALCDSMAAAAGASPGFVLHPRAVVPRPSARRAGMLWLAFDDPSGGAALLADRLTQSAAPFGAEIPGRDYSAHATLCRARRPHSVDTTALDALNSRLSGVLTPVSVVSVTLFSSLLTPSGPVYEREATWPLGGDA